MPKWQHGFWFLAMLETYQHTSNLWVFYTNTKKYKTLFEKPHTLLIGLFNQLYLTIFLVIVLKARAINKTIYLFVNEQSAACENQTLIGDYWQGQLSKSNFYLSLSTTRVNLFIHALICLN